VVIEAPVVKGVSKDGVAYTKDFDVKFLTAQRTLLLEERAALLGQATRLEDEANSLIEEQEMGDVQFDDEGGEGDTMVGRARTRSHAVRAGASDDRRHRIRARPVDHRPIRLLARVRPANSP
jgi:hypothetical protein